MHLDTQAETQRERHAARLRTKRDKELKAETSADLSLESRSKEQGLLSISRWSLARICLRELATREPCLPLHSQVPPVPRTFDQRALSSQLVTSRQPESECISVYAPQQQPLLRVQSAVFILSTAFAQQGKVRSAAHSGDVRKESDPPLAIVTACQVKVLVVR